MLSSTTSGRRRVDLESYRDEIIDLYKRGLTSHDICETLRQRHDVRVTYRTVQRRLKDWQIPDKRYELKETDELKELVTEYFRIGFNDNDIHKVLEKKGYKIGLSGLASFRRRLGLKRRINPGESEAATEHLKKIIQRELNSGGVESFGVGLLHTHLKNKGYNGARDRIWRILQEIDPEGIERRRNDWQRKRGVYNAYGPNYVWSVDGHDKLSHWGFQIYGAIDGYSRFITWIYVGISNRAGFSVLRQFLDTLQTSQQPLHIRSDKGSETTHLAAAHYALYRTQEGKENSKIGECYWYGTSTLNQRIEAWWSHLQKSCLGPWRDYFNRLSEERLFLSDYKAHRIAMLAVYMPIVRDAVATFVDAWNNHSIRKQNNRPEGVYGVPSKMYMVPDDNIINYGLWPDKDLLSELSNAHSHWDMDEFLPKQTLEWCYSILYELGFADLKYGDVFADGERMHVQAYIQLRDCVQEHIESRSLPLLEECPKPTEDRGFHPNLDVALDHVLRVQNERDGVE